MTMKTVSNTHMQKWRQAKRSRLSRCSWKPNGKLLSVFYDMITLVCVCACFYILSFSLSVFFSPCSVKHYVSYSLMKNKPRNAWQLTCSLYYAIVSQTLKSNFFNKISNVRQSNLLYLNPSKCTILLSRRSLANFPWCWLQMAAGVMWII